MPCSVHTMHLKSHHAICILQLRTAANMTIFNFSSTQDPDFDSLHWQQHKRSDSYWSLCTAARIIRFLAVFIFNSTSDKVPGGLHLFPSVQMLRNSMDRLMHIGKISKLCPETNPPPQPENCSSCNSWSRIPVVRNAVVLTGNNERTAFFLLQRRLNDKGIFLKSLVVRWIYSLLCLSV
jgi:hypothetical protein